LNLLLTALPSEEQRRLEPHLERVSLQLRDPLIDPGETIRYVYFPDGSVASSVHAMRDGSTVETSITGFEGMVGVQVWLRQRTTLSRIFVQVPGDAWRMRSDVFLNEVVKRQSPLNDVIADYVHAYLSITTITAACNRIHRIEERLCRWLKMVHNRVDGNYFPVRHEFLAYMLGVHRPSVSIAANILKKAGLIQYDYGRLTVLDAAGLEAGACECYSTMEAHFEGMYGESFRKQKSLAAD
jgi:CRP-like cAMP-binding protein